MSPKLVGIVINLLTFTEGFSPSPEGIQSLLNDYYQVELISPPVVCYFDAVGGLPPWVRIHGLVGLGRGAR